MPWPSTIDCVGPSFGLISAAPSHWARAFMNQAVVSTDPATGARLYTAVFLNPGISAQDWAEHCGARIAGCLDSMELRVDFTPVPRPHQHDGTMFELQGVPAGASRAVRLLAHTLWREELVACNLCWADEAQFEQVRPLATWLCQPDRFSISPRPSWRQLRVIARFDADMLALFSPSISPVVTVTPLDDAGRPVWRSPAGDDAGLPRIGAARDAQGRLVPAGDLRGMVRRVVG